MEKGGNFHTRFCHFYNPPTIIKCFCDSVPADMKTIVETRNQKQIRKCNKTSWQGNTLKFELCYDLVNLFIQKKCGLYLVCLGGAAYNFCFVWLIINRYYQCEMFPSLGKPVAVRLVWVERQNISILQTIPIRRPAQLETMRPSPIFRTEPNF